MEHHVDLTGTADEGEVWNRLVQMPVRTPLLGGGFELCRSAFTISEGKAETESGV